MTGSFSSPVVLSSPVIAYHFPAISPHTTQKGKRPYGFFPFFDCRDDRTRTGDPYVPNVVRYQLRYIPIAL